MTPTDSRSVGRDQAVVSAFAGGAFGRYFHILYRERKR